MTDKEEKAYRDLDRDLNAEVLDKEGKGLDSIVEQLVPGDLIFGAGHAKQSLMIRNLTGPWSHAAIYAGRRKHDGKSDIPMVVECRSVGPVMNTLQALRDMYPDGMAWGRIEKHPARGRKALAWALCQYRGHRKEVDGNVSDEELTREYSVDDLALAGVLIARAKLRDLLRLPDLTSEESQQLARDFEAADQEASKRSKWTVLDGVEQHWTCTSFVYQAFDETGPAISPLFRQGIRRQGPVVFDPTTVRDFKDASLQSALLNVARPDEWAVQEQEFFGPHKKDAKAWLKQHEKKFTSYVPLMRKIVPRLRKLRYIPSFKTAMQIRHVVGPNDLWASYDLLDRKFLTLEDKRRTEDFASEKTEENP